MTNKPELMNDEEINKILHEQGQCKATNLRDALAEMQDRYRAVVQAEYDHLIQVGWSSPEQVKQGKQKAYDLGVKDGMEKAMDTNEVGAELKQKVEEAEQRGIKSGLDAYESTCTALVAEAKDEADSKWVSVLKKHKMTVDSPESLAVAVDLLVKEAVKARTTEIISWIQSYSDIEAHINTYHEEVWQAKLKEWGVSLSARRERG